MMTSRFPPAWLTLVILAFGPVPLLAQTGINAPGGVAARDIRGGQFNIGLNEEKLVEVLDKRGITQNAETAGLQRRVIITLAQRLKPEENLDFDHAVTELERAVRVALDVIASGKRAGNDDSFVNLVLARVADRIRSDDLDGGAKTIDEALVELRANNRRSEVALLGEGVKVDTLRRDAASVARRIEMIVAINEPSDRPPWSPEFGQRYDGYLTDGATKGVNFSLSVAIELARRMVATAHGADERGNGLMLLGSALWTLGERESGTARLEEAVAAYRAALEEWRRDRVPLDWARTQNNLGAALRTLGARESGTARLEEAVAAYRAALEERTRDRVPLEWAMTQMNLGIALWALGERESGTARLEEAVAAHRAALEEATRDRVPLDWALTQNNLGAALRTLGPRESGTARLEEAVAAYRAALEEWTRDRVPLDWAMTQNLGNALWTLGRRESGTARLEAAVAAYDGALQIFLVSHADYYETICRSSQARALALIADRRK